MLLIRVRVLSTRIRGTEAPNCDRVAPKRGKENYEAGCEDS